MSAADSPRGCRCAACRLEAAELLLRTGRAAMAARLLEGLGDAVREEREAAFRAGVEQGRRVAPRPEAPRPEPPAGGSRPGFKRQAAELVQHVDRLGLTRTAEMLGVRPVDMPELLAGTVQAPPAGMARVRRAAQETDDVPF